MPPAGLTARPEAARVLPADLDSNRRDDLVIHFPGYGLWMYSEYLDLGAAGNAVNPTRMAAGDIDANGVSDFLVIDFGPAYGVWTRRNNSTWSALHPRTTCAILLVDRDGDRRDEILVDFCAPLGLWQNANGVWSQVHALNPDLLLKGCFH